MVNKTEYEQSELEAQLDDFNPLVRLESLTKLCYLAQGGEIEIPEVQEIANLHCHTFFSYNGYGYSPSHLVWLGKKMGAKFLGIVDFDVLDGVQEFLKACEIASLRGTAGMETRVFIPEYQQLEINSPGEPGISYHMGIGFTSNSAPQPADTILADIRQRAFQRNLQVLERVNAFLHPLELDYEADILPLTPNRNATERHMVIRIIQKAAEQFDDVSVFWQGKLNMTADEIKESMQKDAAFQDLVRKKLIKRGGVGYIQPTPETFPLIDEIHHVVLACGALPCVTWLDGTSPAEEKIKDLLELLVEKGATAINIVPDRNWNITDPQIKAIKLQKLYQVVEVAGSLHLPIAVGTEMNSYGQKKMDDFNVPELAPVREAFLDGACILYAHTQMQRHWGMGYLSQWANHHFSDRRTKNDFYLQAGKLIPPQKKSERILQTISTGKAPDEVLNALKSIQE